MENERRLSERILSALELAVEQEDVAVAEKLFSAFELASTRLAGGADFAERRDMSAKAATLIDRYRALTQK